ncbi:MAG TPA: hypothetical protein GX510_08810 [Firmicutes bacterium]|nr:hypothetical protein [Candidatus Fermentithermobacillaceae bacterium]
MKVCVDWDSIDQYTLTKAEFADLPVEPVDVGYMQIPLALLQARADAAVWNADDLFRCRWVIREVR